MGEMLDTACMGFCNFWLQRTPARKLKEHLLAKIQPPTYFVDHFLLQLPSLAGAESFLKLAGICN